MVVWLMILYAGVIIPIRDNRYKTKIKDVIIDLGGHDYKYLGTVIDNKLSLEANTDAVCKKVRQPLFFSFQVCNVLMTLIYSCFIESVLTYCIVALFNCPSLTSKNKLAKVVDVDSKVIRVQQYQLQDSYSKWVIN